MNQPVRSKTPLLDRIAKATPQLSSPPPVGWIKRAQDRPAGLAKDLSGAVLATV